MERRFSGAGKSKDGGVCGVDVCGVTSEVDGVPPLETAVARSEGSVLFSWIQSMSVSRAGGRVICSLPRM